MPSVQPVPVSTAVGLVDAASSAGIDLRIHGSCGCYLRARLYREGGIVRRVGDVDLFLSDPDQADSLIELFESLDYRWDRRFSLHANGRLFFWSNSDLEVDVSIAQLRFCHTFDPAALADGNPYTIGLAALLLEKLQMVPGMEPKDVLDVVALLESASLKPGGENYLEIRGFAELASRSWGFYHAVTENLRTVASSLPSTDCLSAAQREHVLGCIQEIIEKTSRIPKSLAFRLRAPFGTHLPWYTHVDSRIR